MTSEFATSHAPVINIPTAMITRDVRFQPRQDVDKEWLCDLVEVEKMRHVAIAAGFANGIDPAKLKPVDVWFDEASNKFFLLHGYHRFALGNVAGLDAFLAQVHRCDFETALAISRRGNMPGKILSPMEESAIFKAEMDRGRSAAEIAGDYDRRSATAVDRRALLAYLTPGLQAAVSDKSLRVDYAEAIGEAARDGASPALQQWLRDFSQSTKSRAEVFRQVVRRVMIRAKEAHGQAANGKNGQILLFDLPADAGIAAAKQAISDATRLLQQRDRWRRFAVAGQGLLKADQSDQSISVVEAIDLAEAKVTEINKALGIVGGEGDGIVAEAVGVAENATTIGRMARPVMRWVGSKEWALDRIVPIVRKALGETGILIEPFAGSAAVTLAVAPARGVLADYCGPLMAVYEALKTDPRALHEEMMAVAKEYGNGEESFKAAKADFNRILTGVNKEFTVEHKAALLIYLNRTDFNGLYRSNKKGEFNVPYGKRTPAFPTLADFTVAARAIAGVRIMTGDWMECLRSVEDLGQGSVIYADPPYEGTFDGYGKPWNEADHDHMASVMKSLVDAGVKVIISQPDNPVVRKRYVWAHHMELSRSKGYAVGGKAARREAAGELVCVGGFEPWGP